MNTLPATVASPRSILRLIVLRLIVLRLNVSRPIKRSLFTPRTGSGTRSTLLLGVLACLCSGLLTGCANIQWGATPSKASTSVTPSTPAVTAPLPVAVDSSNDNLPNTVLSAELLYKILTAEIAFQRGNWEASYITLLSAAQQTRDPRLARRAAEMALSAGQNREALVATRLWRELAPQSNEAAQYYLGFMLVNNNLAEIERVFTERLHEAKPAQYGALMLQAQRLLMSGRDKDAGFKVLETVLAPYSTIPEAHLALAQAAYQHEDKARARAEARIALQAKPDSQLAILTVAQASTPEDAAKALADFLVSNPKAKDVRLAYASILIEFKQFDAASAQFEQFLRDNPNDINPIYTLGVLAMQRQKPKEAESYFTRYLRAAEADNREDEDLSRVYFNLAQLAAERNDNAAAQSWLARVEPSDGKNTAWISAQIRRAALMIKDGKLAEARHFLQEVKTNDAAEQVQLIQAESQFLREAKQQSEAFTFLQKNLLNFPDNVDLLYDFAMVAENQNKLPEMEAALRHAIELAPDNANAYNALGYSLADRNIRLDEALTLLEKAVQLSKGDPFILDSYGWVKFRLGKFDEAEQALRQAYGSRTDVEIAAHLGEVLWAQNKQSEARQIWHDAATKDAANETLKNTLQRLGVKL